jgi:hypothetical protein
MDDVAQIIATRAASTRHCVALIRREAGDEAVERLIRSELRFLFDLAIATLGRDHAVGLVRQITV